MSASFPVDMATEMVTELEVSEIERLAKAGVAITLTAIMPKSDARVELEYPSKRPLTLEDAFWQRYIQRVKSIRSGQLGDGMLKNFSILCSQHNDDIWMSVHPTNFNYEPFQLRDYATVFPSDKLMAEIALWEQHHK